MEAKCSGVITVPCQLDVLLVAVFRIRTRILTAVICKPITVALIYCSIFILIHVFIIIFGTSAFLRICIYLVNAFAVIICIDINIASHFMIVNVRPCIRLTYAVELTYKIIIFFFGYIIRNENFIIGFIDNAICIHVHIANVLRQFIFSIAKIFIKCAECIQISLTYDIVAVNIHTWIKVTVSNISPKAALNICGISRIYLFITPLIVLFFIPCGIAR